MKTLKLSSWIVLSLAVVIMLAGCRTPQANTNMQQIPQITKLYQKATSTQVHRFRKPLRDEQARALRMLATECDRMLAELGTEGVSAEALTGTGTEGAPPNGSLQAALVGLREAANQGDLRKVHAAHAAAASAYAQRDEP